MSTPPYPQCVGCNTPVLPPRTKWCSDACAERHRPKRDRTGQKDYHGPRPRRKTKPPLRFVGVDGESIDGRYMLLAAASDDGWHASVEAPTQLTTRQCLTFVSNIPKGMKAWGFAFGYDVNMMLGDLPVERVTYLYEHGHVYWKEFRIAYVPGKKLTVTRYHGSYKGAPVVASTTVWDAFIWMQSSFVNWIEAWQLAPPKDIARIRKMKAQRSTFSDDDRKAIKRYCLSECEYLAAGARKLVTLIADAGINTATYYSPATISKALLKREHVMEHRADVPTEIENAVDSAYYGGRAEVGVVGPVDGPLFQYDIRSAYPAASVTLPCLACGRWEHVGEPYTSFITPWSLCKVSWRPKRGHPNPVWGPLPVRPRTGSLRWPTHGTGWYWGVEVLAAMRHATIDVKDVWQFRTMCEHEPFAYLRDLYEQRAALKAAGEPTEFVLKLALNATYGALAEHPHGSDKPKYRCLAWAGWITAATRAALLDVLTDDVVLMATDSLISRTPLPVTLGTGLGEWEVEQYDEMFIAGTGIYYGKRDGEWSKHKTRGFESGQLSRESLETLWDSEGRHGRVRLSRQRFIGMGTALHRVHGFYPPYKRLWRQFITEPCDKSLDMTPRRAWTNGDRHDGRTLAPTLASHIALERSDRERLRNLYAQYADTEVRLARAEARTSNRTPTALHELRVTKLQERLLLLAALIDDAEHGRTTVWSDADDPSV